MAVRFHVFPAHAEAKKTRSCRSNMSTYVALVQHTEQGDGSTDRAATDIKVGAAVAERLGIEVRDFYWASGTYNAVLVLQTADKHEITAWKDSLQNLRVELIPAGPDPDSVKQMTTSGRSSSSDLIQWWY